MSLSYKRTGLGRLLNALLHKMTKPICIASTLGMCNFAYPVFSLSEKQGYFPSHISRFTTRADKALQMFTHFTQEQYAFETIHFFTNQLSKRKEVNGKQPRM